MTSRHSLCPLVFPLGPVILFSLAKVIFLPRPILCDSGHSWTLIIPCRLGHPFVFSQVSHLPARLATVGDLNDKLVVEVTVRETFCYSALGPRGPPSQAMVDRPPPGHEEV